jgi:hypothetical protein
VHPGIFYLERGAIPSKKSLNSKGFDF